MSCIFPHHMFQADFIKMFQEVQRQEDIDPFHEDESDNGQEIFFFFAENILPLIKTDDWVYDSAIRFVTDYADEYFIMLRRLKSVEDVQARLERLREEVAKFIKSAMEIDLAPTTVKLSKLSDFVGIMELEKMPENMQKTASQLHDEAVDLERLHVDVTSQAIKSMYERGFPRIFYVVNRALKKKLGSKHSISYDNNLQAPHNYLDWCSQHLEPQHIISKLFVNHRKFYKTTRNVDSHFTGLKWHPETNQVYLPDQKNSLTVDVGEFSQRYRYLMYFCEIGAKGILATVCEQEQGAIANAVKDRYLKMYKNPELQARMCNYPT